MESRRIYDFKLNKCSAEYFFIPVQHKVGPIYMRMIKDVDDSRDLELKEFEDCKILMSKFNRFPTPIDYLSSYAINE